MPSAINPALKKEVMMMYVVYDACSEMSLVERALDAALKLVCDMIDIDTCNGVEPDYYIIQSDSDVILHVGPRKGTLGATEVLHRALMCLAEDVVYDTGDEA